jgi:acyl-CoA synthetase (AMP-forming)/AMP-acid ligase II
VLVGFTAVLMSPIDFIKNPVGYLHVATKYHFPLYLFYISLLPKFVFYSNKYKATLLGGPNFGFELLVKRVTEADMKVIDLSRVRIAANGAEPGFCFVLFLFFFFPY